MHTSIGFGIIGLSNIARIHMQAIRNLEGCHLVAASSRDAEKRAILHTETGLTTFADHYDLVKHPDIQAVCICTASGFHLEPALAAARAGKHVFCEKPLETKVEKAWQMIQECRTCGVKLACVFQNRFRPDFEKLRKAVVTGRLGKLIHGNAIIPWYRSPEYYGTSDWKGTIHGDGGGALINQGIHTIDLLQLLFGPVHSVWGKVRTAMHSIEGEDLGNAYLSFSNGASATILASTALWPGYPERLEVFGTQGSIIYEGGFINDWNIIGNIDQLPINSVDGHDASDPNLADASLHQKQLSDFIVSIREDRNPLVNGEEGMKSLRIIQAIYESSLTGEVIEF